MAALWQVIVYREYLPLVLGPDEIRKHGLELEHSGYWDGIVKKIFFLLICKSKLNWKFLLAALIFTIICNDVKFLGLSRLR
jgi:hypothetical protein